MLRAMLAGLHAVTETISFRWNKRKERAFGDPVHSLFSFDSYGSRFSNVTIGHCRLRCLALGPLREWILEQELRHH